MADLDLPVTAANIDRFYDTVFAPWVKAPLGGSIGFSQWRPPM